MQVERKPRVGQGWSASGTLAAVRHRDRLAGARCCGNAVLGAEGGQPDAAARDPLGAVS